MLLSRSKTAIIEFIDIVWLSGDLKESMSEEEYLEFRKIVESMLP